MASVNVGVKARITIELLDNGEVNVKCEGDIEVCKTYMAYLKTMGNIINQFDSIFGVHGGEEEY